MGVIGAAIKIIIIPIAIVVLLGLILAFVWHRKRKSKDDIEQAQPPPAFVSYAPPPTYNDPMAKPPVAVVHSAHPAG
ncbi:hypothetical protein HIM_08499 [Hirsutella minnesotensis 3608]|uniref:Uncharacterized protein n=1 Tax=Hirsutella minnesotensis 3608 TaxID=1043627 RepID=A0A0F7ZH70_9HYPO|nr:hypothetical protein HIM_08499 [Hirsutella minnesotensis 3608]